MADKSSLQLVQENRKELVNKICDMMSQGVLPWKRGWQVPFRMHNPITHKNGAGYRGINCIYLMMQSINKGYTDPRWVTFKQAEANGWKVKAKEKGTRIEHWKFGKEVEIDDPDNPGEKIKAFEPYKHPAVSYYTVFNAEQIEGMTPLEVKRLDLSKDTELDSLIKDVKDSSLCPINEENQPRAFYSPRKDTITLPLMEMFDSKQEYLGTMLHEMGHSTGHESRLNRNLLAQGGPGSESYALEELRAELSSVFVQDDLGISLPDSSIENNAAYLQSWISAIKENPNALFEAVRDADEISRFLMDGIEQTRSHSQEQTQENAQEQQKKPKQKAMDLDIDR